MSSKWQTYVLDTAFTPGRDTGMTMTQVLTTWHGVGHSKDRSSMEHRGTSFASVLLVLFLISGYFFSSLLIWQKDR